MSQVSGSLKKQHTFINCKSCVQELSFSESTIRMPSFIKMCIYSIVYFV